MKLSKLTQASEYEVKDWLIKELDLTPYQKGKVNYELIRFSPFKFYKYKQKEKVSLLWRFTVLALPVYIVLLWIVYLVKWLFTGEWGFSNSFMDNFHYKWMDKIKIYN